jgi:conjugal transfer pilin signal peptidase TrbI
VSTVALATIRHRTAVFWPLFVRALRRWWYLPLVTALPLLVAGQFVTFGFNATESLPARMFLVLKWDKEVKAGDLVAFKWTGSKPYPPGLLFVKVVGGVGGDTVTRQGRQYAVNGQAIAEAREYGSRGPMAGVPLELGPTGTIPQGHYFVHTPHPQSLDSRYALLGWVRPDQVIGRAVVLF